MTNIGALLPLFAGVPIIASAAAVLIPFSTVRRVLAFAVPAASLIGAFALLLHLRGEAAVAINIGSFVPGVSIPLVSDTFSALILTLCALVTVLGVWLSDATGDIRRNRYFTALTLLLLGGVNGAILTGDLFNLFVWVEVMLLPSYALLAMTGTKRRISAGRLFVIVNLVTSTLLLAAVGFVYGVAGTVNLSALAGAAREDGRLAFALGLVLVALCIKAGATPVHGWLPQTYPHTSPGVMALFAGLHTKVALYAVIRVWTVAFDLDPTWGWLLLAVALATTLTGSIASSSGSRVRSVIAWQMVAGVGVILASLAVGSTQSGIEGAPQLAAPLVTASLTATIVYMIHHIITVGGLISAFGVMEHHYGAVRVSGRNSLHGMWWRERSLAIVAVVLVASLIGLPLTSGLIGKFEVVRAGAEAGGWTGLTMLAVVCLGWFFGLIAMIRLWRRVMWDRGASSGSAPEYEDADADADAGDDEATDVETESAPAPEKKIAGIAKGPAIVFAGLSIAMFFGYQPFAETVDSAVSGLIDTRGYVQSVLGPDAVEGHSLIRPLGGGEGPIELFGGDASFDDERETS